MIDRFEVERDQDVPYKQVRVAPTVLNEYLPPSVKEKFPLLLKDDGNVSVAQLYVDSSIDDLRLHVGPSVASNMGISSENQVVDVEQSTLFEAENLTVEFVSSDEKIMDEKAEDIIEYLEDKLENRYVFLDEKIRIPEEVTQSGIDIQISDYKPSENASAAFITDSTNIMFGKETGYGQSDETNNHESDTGDEPEKNLGDLDEPKQMKDKVTYESIGGLRDELEKIREIVERPLVDPEAFQGVPNPSGVLVYGPPGTGKTLLARAVANEVDASFYALSGAEIFDRNYGESEENLRSLFEQAREQKPSIIFIDELEALIPSRDGLSGGNQVEKRVVTQLKTLIDGFSSEDGVVILGATNHPEEIDDAFLRPGRFDRTIEIGVPDSEGRKEILNIHTQNMNLRFGSEYFEKLIRETTGYTGADIADLCMKANMHMQRRLLDKYPKYTGRQRVSSIIKNENEGYTKEDFEEALSETKPSLLERFNIDVPKVRWGDIGGYSEVKQSIREHVDGPIKAPELWDASEFSTGILLYGPPGTGKTLLSKAMATESDRVFIGVQATELRSKWVGETEKNIRQLFTLAESLSPSIVYIDEIEAIAQPRGANTGDSGVSNSATSQLLSELDGIENRDGVVVVGSTNASYDPETPLHNQQLSFGLDPAILRPGRLEVHFYIPKPDIEERKEIFKIHLNKVSDDSVVSLDSDIDVGELSEKAEDTTGADIEAICWKAKSIARNSIIQQSGGLEDVGFEEITIKQRHLIDSVKDYSQNPDSEAKPTAFA